MLIRGLQNLDSFFEKGFNFVSAKPPLRRADSRFGKPRKFPARERIGTFCGVQKVPQKHAEGCDPLDSRGRFKALPEKILAKFSDGTSRTRLFAQNGGEKALNRCEVRALQRKDLERRLKEQRYSLRTVGYGWAEMGGGGRKRVALDGNKERLMQMNGFGFAKKAASKCS